MKGRFIGKYKGEFLPGTRQFKHSSYIVFIPNRPYVYSINGFTRTIKELRVVRGDITDGASIPRAFWSLIGSPFTGKYRKSSAVHDVLCKQQKLPSKLVHRIWEDMIETEGVENPRKYLMARAVQLFGPRW